MYQTSIRSFFTFSRKRQEVKLKSLRVKMNGYSDGIMTENARQSLNAGEDSIREYMPKGPFYYLLGSIFREYRELMDRIRDRK